MITLYGIGWSRANYVLFTLEELGLEFKHIKLHPFEDEKNSPEYLNLNPMGQLPTLVDGDLVLTESMAINFYLARKYGDGKLWPDQLEDEAQVYKWTFFAITELEKPCVDIVIQKNFVDEKDRNFDLIKRSEKSLIKPLGVLDSALAGKDYLAANQFSIVDINVASVLSYALSAEFDFSPYQNLQRYLNNILSRPARKRAEAA
ncbi:MAG: glutathione S-transferase family protein [Nitrosomonas sp.]|nr:glutathione S-transferase family protein [Nitrosomonas sp.]